MRVILAASFLKSYKKRIAWNTKLDGQMARRVSLFQVNHSNPILHDHPLQGNKLGLRAFSVTGDVRIVYHCISDDEAEFLDIGTHAQVYG